VLVSTLFVRDTKLVSEVTDVCKMLDMKYIAVFVEVSIQGVRCMTLCKPHIGLNQCKRDHITPHRYKLKPPDWFCNPLSACLCSTSIEYACQ
jgi:hypothetical protein